MALDIKNEPAISVRFPVAATPARADLANKSQNLFF
jgi:hypothetical protein